MKARLFIHRLPQITTDYGAVFRRHSAVVILYLKSFVRDFSSSLAETFFFQSVVICGNLWIKTLSFESKQSSSFLKKRTKKLLFVQSVDH